MAGLSKGASGTSKFRLEDLIFEFKILPSPAEYCIALKYDATSKYRLLCTELLGEEFYVELSDAEGEKLVKLISDARIDAVPKWLHGLDGTHYEMRIMDWPNHVTYHWWGKCPKGWEPLGEVADILMVKTRKHFKTDFDDWGP